MVIAGGGRGGTGSQCLMGTELQSEKIKKSWRWIVVNVLMQLKCTLKSG